MDYSVIPIVIPIYGQYPMGSMAAQWDQWAVLIPIHKAFSLKPIDPIGHCRWGADGSSQGKYSRSMPEFQAWKIPAIWHLKPCSITLT